MSLDFEKYVGKGVIGDLSVVALLHQWCKLKIEKWNISLGHLESKTVQSASCAREHFADTWCSDETWCKVKKNNA